MCSTCNNMFVFGIIIPVSKYLLLFYVLMRVSTRINVISLRTVLKDCRCVWLLILGDVVVPVHLTMNPTQTNPNRWSMYTTTGTRHFRYTIWLGISSVIVYCLWLKYEIMYVVFHCFTDKCLSVPKVQVHKK